MFQAAPMPSDHELIEWSHHGLIPGPDESAEAFVARAQRAQSMTPIPSVVHNLFQIHPDWISVVHDAKHLNVWEGAATWIDASSCHIQIHPAQKKEEVLAHEIVHAVRMGFQEPRFEEILAYQTSTRRWYRYFGPLFTKSYEMKVFIGLVLLSWVLLAFGVEWLVYTPFVFVAGCVARLVGRQRIFQRALKRVPLALLLRLTDREIVFVSKSTPEAMRSYAQEQSAHDLRWRQIELCGLRNLGG